jgi:hypothetical protein
MRTNPYADNPTDAAIPTPVFEKVSHIVLPKLNRLMRRPAVRSVLHHAIADDEQFEPDNHPPEPSGKCIDPYDGHPTTDDHTSNRNPHKVLMIHALDSMSVISQYKKPPVDSPLWPGT